MGEPLNSLCIYYIIIMSLIGFIVMGIDKRKSRKKAWRISENTLLSIAFLGGGIGSFLGMYLFRHKTKKRKFIVSFPIAAMIYMLILLKLYHII